MNEQLVDRRLQAWLEEGPMKAPPESLDTIMGRIADDDAQVRPPVRLLGRRMEVRWLAAAAILVAVAATLIVFRDPIVDVISPPPQPTSLLSDRSDLSILVEAQGGPSDAAETIALGQLTGERGLVIAGACTGTGTIAVQLVPVFEAGQGEPEPDPYVELPVPCDGERRFTTHARSEIAPQELELRVAADAGTTWRVAAGELRDSPSQPAFPAMETGEGRLLLVDGFATLNTGPADRTPGIGFDPRGATSVVLLVQCLGDPVTVWATTGRDGEDEMVGGPVGTVECTDPSRTVEVPVEVRGQGSARAVSDGFTWAKIGAAIDAADIANGRPAAPPLPDGVGETWFAEGDGESVAFGQLGSNEQQIVRVEGGWTSNTAGDVVAVSEADPAGGAHLRLWSASRAEPVADLATVPGIARVPAWVDATHEQVIYLRPAGLGALEIHRVGFDGRDDRVLATTADGAFNDAQGALAVDDAVFVLHWCPPAGECGRTIVDLATGTAETLSLGRESLCLASGVADGHVAGMMLPCEGQLSVEALDGSGRVDVGGVPSMAMMVQGSDGPRLVVLDYGETESVLWSYGPDGSDRREVTRFEHGSFANPYLSPVRVPVPGWVLMAGPLSDAPTDFTDSPTPELVNIETGERIPLPNLPGPE